MKIEDIEKMIRKMFPTMSNELVKEIAYKYFIEKLLDKAKTMTPEQMKREIG